MHYRFPRLIGILMSIVISGCSTAPQHSNTLMFGTDTKVAFDVSSSPANAGTPGITLGYKRVEAVWMPLLANLKLGKEAAPCGQKVTEKPDSTATNSDNIKDCLFQGTEDESMDTYSVLASFGSKFSGDASVSENGLSPKAGAKAGLAQYFATGLAARELAKAGGAQLVSTTATPPENQKLENIKDRIKAEKSVTNCAYPSGNFNKSNWEKIVKGANINDQDKAWFLGLSEKELKDILDVMKGGDPELIQLEQSASKVCKK